MPFVCCVPSCTSRKGKKGANGLFASFHEFPSDYIRSSKWEEEIFRHTLVPYVKSSLPVVCSLHFKESDFVPNIKLRKLKNTAVPSIFEDVPGVSPSNFSHSNNERITPCKNTEDKSCITENIQECSVFAKVLEDNLYCRLCAKLDEECIPIFEAEGNEMELNKKIHKYLPVNVSESDSLPDKICPSCVTAINAWHEYAESCLTAEFKLQEIFPTTVEKTTDLKMEECEVVSTTTDNITMENQELSDTQDILHITVNTVGLNVVNIGEDSDNVSANEVCEVKMLNEDSDPLTDKKTFTCIFCNEKFEDLQSWYQHKRKMHSSGTYKCNSCSLVFNNNVSLLAHKILQHNYRLKKFVKRKLRACPICNKQVFKQYFRKHLAIHDNVCKKCFQSFPDSEQYNLHKRTHYFLCETCGKNLNSKEALTNHSMLHSSDMKSTDMKLIKCEECNRSFSNKGKLKLHIQFKHLNEKIVCEICGAEFDIMSTYKKHIKAGHPVKCSLCGKVFKNERHFKNHVGVCCISSAMESLKCMYCDKTFVSQHTLKAHIKYKHVFQKTTCEKCGKIFDTVAAYRVHLKGTHSIRFKCNFCRCIYSSENRLNEHMQIHRDSPDAQPLTCEECNMTFKSKISLSGHIKGKHVIQNTICDACGNDYISIAAYKKHFRQVHLKPRPFKCNLCVKEFLTEKGLAFHMDVRHKMTSQCEKCGFLAKSNYSLKRHMKTHKSRDIKTTNPNSKTYEPNVQTYDPNAPRKLKNYKSKVCDICGITTRTMYRHKLKVHKIYRNKCRFCDKTYIQRIDMESHERSKHTGERIFECHVCGKSFFSKSNLDGHSQIHSTSLNFTCQYCKRKFHTRSNRNDHRRRCPYKIDTSVSNDKKEL